MSIWTLSDTTANSTLDAEKPVSGVMGLIYGLHVYTTFLWPTKESTWKQHWERLKQNANDMDLAFDFDEQTTLRQIQTVFKSETPILRLAVIADTTEYREFWVEPTQKLPSKLVLSARPCAPVMNNMTLQTALYQRPMPLIKSAAMAESIVLKRHALANGAHEVLFLGRTTDKADLKTNPEVDRTHQRIQSLRSPSWETETQDYFIRECGMANIFILEANPNPSTDGKYSQLRLRTPNPDRDGCLPGITRQQILNAAERIGLTVFDDEKPLTLASLHDAHGVFMGNAASGLTSISKIQHAIGEKPLQLTIHWSSEAQTCLQELQQLL